MEVRSPLSGMTILCDQAGHLHGSYYERDSSEIEVQCLDIRRNPCNTVFPAKRGFWGKLPWSALDLPSRTCFPLWWLKLKAEVTWKLTLTMRK